MTTSSPDTLPFRKQRKTNWLRRTGRTNEQSEQTIRTLPTSYPQQGHRSQAEEEHGRTGPKALRTCLTRCTTWRINNQMRLAEENRNQTLNNSKQLEQ